MNIYRDLNQLPTFKKSVITIGSFDGLHLGHRKILLRVTSLAKEIGSPNVLITFYPHPRKIVDPSTDGLEVLDTLNEKIDRLKSLGIDNLVIIPFSFEFSRMAPREYIENFIIKYFSPAYIVIGYDHRFGLNRGGDIMLLKEYGLSHGFEVIEIVKQELEEIGISSTAIRKSLRSGDIAEANKFLGAPYVLSGTVVHGDKFGTKLGYPTANIQVTEKDKLIPKSGIYAVEAIVDAVKFNGILYIGPRPTIGANLPSVIEVHLFEFDQNIYERHIGVQLLSFIRDDKKLESLDALRIQMQKDEEHALAFFEDFDTKLSSTIDHVATIAILNYNGLEMLESYLPMVEYSSSSHNVEIMVIDNASTDDSVEYLEEWHPEVKLIQLSKNYGFAEGYNRGLSKNVTAPYIIFLNSDVLVPDNWLDPIITMMDNDPKIGAVQPLIMSLEDKNSYEHAGAAGGFIDRLGYPFCRGRVFDKVERETSSYATDREIFWASGAAMVIRTKLFYALGGFDNSFFAHQEEIDLCWRVKKAGYQVWVCSSSKVFHLGGGTLDYANPKKTYYNFRNNLFMLTKNEHFTTLLWLLPIKLVLDGIAGIKFLLEGNIKHVVSILKAHLAFYATLPTIVENNNKDNQYIEKVRIGPDNSNSARYNGSVVFDFYVRGRKTFNKIMN